MYMPTRRKLGGLNRCKIDYSFEANKGFYSLILILGFIILVIGVCSNY